MISDKMLQLGLCFLTFMVNYNKLLPFKIIDRIYTFSHHNERNVYQEFIKEDQELSRTIELCVYFLRKRCV